MGNTLVEGPPGTTPLWTNLDSSTKNVIRLKATSAIAAKTVVAFDTANSGQVVQAGTGTATTVCFGISLAAAAAGAYVDIALPGSIVRAVNAQGAIAAGGTASRSATTAGFLAANTPAADEFCCIALAAAASNLVDVYVRS